MIVVALGGAHFETAAGTIRASYPPVRSHFGQVALQTSDTAGRVRRPAAVAGIESAPLALVIVFDELPFPHRQPIAL